MELEDYVLRYLELGWVIQPVAEKGGKRPAGNNWPNLPAEKDPRKYKHGIYLVCGRRSGVSVIDLDGTDYFSGTLAELTLGQTPYASTPSGGAHVLVSHSTAEWWGNQVKFAPNLDLRNDRGGVVLPSGEPERLWAPKHEPWHLAPADPAPFEQWLQSLVGKPQSRRPGTHTLTELLTSPALEGSRNDWLSHVAGHLAVWVPFEDAFLALLQSVNRSLDEPLSEEEVRTTVGKTWKRDRDRNPVSASGSPWNERNGKLYYTSGQGQQRTPELWLEPVPEVRSVRRNKQGHPSWELARERSTVVVTSSEVHNTQKLSVALGNLGVGLHPRATGSKPCGVEFQKWLEEQGAPSVAESPHWGWSDELHEWVGLGDSTTVGPEGYKPVLGELDRPDLVEQLPTWQTPHTAAVFCSWVALQAVKGKVSTLIEPNLVLQGAAGSGKTRGLFAFGSRLTGSVRTAIGTIPTLRDRLAGHRNGIVVLDDQSDLDSSHKLLELYRLATSAEAVTLKHATGSGWVEHRVPLVGSMLVSGEALTALSTDRALRDRSVILEVRPANQRKSLLDPSRLQWADLQAVFEELGGNDESVANQLAGPFVRRLLDAVDVLGQPPRAPGERVTAKLELLKYGSRLWQQAYPNSRTEDGRTVVEVCAEWCDLQHQTSDWRDLTLVTRILPELVDPSSGAFTSVKTDQEGLVVLHTQRLAREWQRRYPDPRNRELGSVDNVKRELEVLKEADLATYGRTLKMGSTYAKVWTLEALVSEHVTTLAGVVLNHEGVVDRKLDYGV